jgi:glycosyltransferase involved in cell wall biosynthesis
MDICLVSTFPPAPCGIATYCSYLIDGLLSANMEVRITVLAEGPVAKDLRPRVHVIDAFSEDSDYVPMILHQVRACAPDVVHIQHEYGIFGFDDRFLRLLAGLRGIRIPIVVTLHTVHTRFSLDVSNCGWRAERRLPTGVDIEKLQRELCELSDLIVVHQDWPMRTTLIEQGACADRVASISHGTRKETGIPSAVAKERLGYASDTPLLVAFGYFEVSKNHQRLLEAFSLLRRRQPNAKLWIGGHVRQPSPPALEYKARIENLIHQMGLREHVTLWEEALPESEVQVLLSAADVGCFVYREDTYSSSGALHRTLGFGKPVVASCVPKFHELRQIAPEILADPDSPEEIARLLIRLLEDCAFRTRIAGKALRFASQTSWHIIAKAHLEVYHRATAAVEAEFTASVGGGRDAQADSGYVRGA